MWKKTIEKRKTNMSFLTISYGLSGIISLFVYFTGGTNRVYSNLMYIPIAIVSSIYGKKVGVLHAAISAILIGPFMPLNVKLNQSQEFINWVLRLIIYIIIALIIGFFSDYDKKTKNYISNLLTHDIITDLKNVESLKKIRNSQYEWFTIIALSVNGFEEKLRLFGYNFTNEAILTLSHRLKSELCKYTNVELYKYDGMEFLIIISHKEEEINIDDIMDSIGSINKSTIKVDNIPIYIELVMGQTKINGDTSILEGLRQSLIALSYASLNNINLKVFESDIDKHYKSVVDIAANFKDAIINDNIKVAYQNIYNSRNDELYGVELLARWVKDDGAEIYPDEFIPVIEKTELINSLTLHMIDKAIKICKNNKHHNIISINFSAKDFKEENVYYLIESIKKNGLSPKKFEVELTEEVLLNKDVAINYLNIIRNQGIKVALDDFGTGYSSYQFLSELPLDVIKIDKSIIKKIVDNKGNRSLIKSIVDYCKFNDIITIAEGVETRDIADTCKDIGIDLLQGYYYHKPTISND